MITKAPKNMMTLPTMAPESAPATRPGTKQETVLAMLKRPEGATLVQICAATDWQPQTARGWLANTIKGRLGHEIQTEAIGNGKKIYRIR